MFFLAWSCLNLSEAATWLDFFAQKFTFFPATQKTPLWLLIRDLARLVGPPFGRRKMNESYCWPLHWLKKKNSSNRCLFLSISCLSFIEEAWANRICWALNCTSPVGGLCRGGWDNLLAKAACTCNEGLCSQQGWQDLFFSEKGSATGGEKQDKK